MTVAGSNRFFVIEGLDGSGKSTQIELLLDYMSSLDMAYRYLHFPRTGTSLYGDLIARYLRGDLGPLESVHPYLVALIFAGDRVEAREMMAGWLSGGQIVVTDRYVISNIAFQCAKLKSQRERQALKEWILKLEYEHHELPRPDLSILLDVPFRFIEKKLTGSRSGEDRSYLLGNADIHERDLKFQKRVRDVYLEMVDQDPAFRIVECGDSSGTILPPELIFDKVRSLFFPD